MINLGGRIFEKQIKIREEYLLNNVNQTTKGNLQFDWGLIKVNEVIDNLREDHYLIKLIDYKELETMVRSLARPT